MGGIPSVKILAQTVEGQEDEQLIMFTSPYLNPGMTYQAVVDSSVSHIPTGVEVVLWVVDNNRGPFDGVIAARVMNITIEGDDR